MQSSKVNEVNTTRVLQQIWLSGGSTRVTLARDLGLVKSTVSRITSQLLEQGIIRETPELPVANGVGRKPILLEINEGYGTIVGMEIQPDFYNAVAIDLHGEVVQEWQGELSMSGTDVARRFTEIAAPIISWVTERGSSLLGMGVAVPGIVDQHRGTIMQSNPLNVRKPIHFLRELEGSIPAPVIVENDANCGCWGELVARKTLRHSNFLYVMGEFRTGRTEGHSYWGIAVGLGIVLNGHVYHGSSYSAGEFQSMLWQAGNDGQLSLTNEEALRIKRDRSVMNRAFREICQHTAFLVNVLNVTGVVFGGEITEYGDELVPMLKEEIQANWSYPTVASCSVECSKFDRSAIAYGAAGMYLESIFTIPELYSRTGATARSQVSVL